MLKRNREYKIKYKNNSCIYYFSKENNKLLTFYIKIKKGHLFFEKDVLIYKSSYIIKTNRIFNYNENKLENFVLKILDKYLLISRRKRIGKIFLRF